MFINSSGHGYIRTGEQVARGSFLLVFTHNPFKWDEEHNKPHEELQGLWFDVTEGDGFVVKAACQCNQYASSLKSCPVHKDEYKSRPPNLHRTLYACVRHVSLRQCGQWMMGVARIAGQSVTVSGSYGSDGLPMDYEKLTPAGKSIVSRSTKGSY